MLDILADIASKGPKALKEEKQENGECDGNQNNAILLNGTLETSVEEERKPLTKVVPCQLNGDEEKQPQFSPQLRFIKMNGQVRELQTILRDRQVF